MKVQKAFEKYNCTFTEMYNNITKLLSNKQGTTMEEQFFIDRPLNEEFRPCDYHSFFTIFTRMYPDIKFRLYEITWDLSKCSTYIFKGNEYVFEKELQDFENNGIKFYNPNIKAYHPNNLQVILDIMEITQSKDGIFSDVNGSSKPYDHCLEYITPAGENLNFKKFEVLIKILLNLRNHGMTESNKIYPSYKLILLKNLPVV